jgi:pimeloyl-ACP methyl ester carboxylesterase
LLAQQHPQVKKFISIAGAGRPIDVVLKEQYSKMNPTVRDSAYSIIDSLKKNVLVPRLSPWLFSVFRPSVQPYIISWMDLDPAAELAKLSIPILIIQGTTDMQVQMADAEALKSAAPTAQLAVLKDMNHVLKKVSNDKSENRNSYNNPSLPLHPELIFQLYPFIKNP